MRTEKLPDEWFDYNSAFSTVTDFYSREEDTTSTSTSNNITTSTTSGTPTTSTSSTTSTSTSITTRTTSMDTQSSLNHVDIHGVSGIENKAEGIIILTTYVCAVAVSYILHCLFLTNFSSSKDDKFARMLPVMSGSPHLSPQCVQTTESAETNTV